MFNDWVKASYMKRNVEKPKKRRLHFQWWLSKMLLEAWSWISQLSARSGRSISLRSRGNSVVGRVEKNVRSEPGRHLENPAIQLSGYAAMMIFDMPL